MPVMTGMMVGGAVLSGIGGISSGRRSAREARRMRRLMQQKLRFAQQQWQHYRETYGDLEQQMVADAMEGVQGDYAGVTSRAAADVEGAFAAERDNNRREMMRYGLDPGSGRFASTERRAGLEQATASAMAQNTARESERRHSVDATWNRRANTGQFGANMMFNAGQGVTGAMGDLAGMHGNNAAQHASMANNLFSQAGAMGMYGALNMGGAPAAGGAPGGGAIPPSGPQYGAINYHSSAPPPQINMPQQYAMQPSQFNYQNNQY